MRMLVLAALLLSATATDARIIRVQPDGAMASIQRAVNQATDGDTVSVPTGTYAGGNVTVLKSITLLGEGRPTLDGGLKHELFTIAAPCVTVSGFRFIDAGRSSLEDMAGIKCLDAHYITIHDNEFDNSFFGIHLSNTDHADITGNRLRSKAEFEYQLGNGIHLWKCTDAFIAGNRIEGHRDGIYFEFVTNSLISDNVSIANMRYGLHFMFSHSDRYEHNLFRGNGAGVSVMYSRNVQMHNNTFEDNWGSAAYGMLLKDITDSHVWANRFVGNTSGIYMEGTSRTVFEHNTFRENGWALKLMASCDRNDFKDNDFVANTFDVSTNGIVMLNTVQNNYWDRYQGYDLDRNGVGDVPHLPVSLFSVVCDRVPSAMMLWRSFLVFLLDRAERLIPAVTPQDMRDRAPRMRPYA